MHQPMSCTLKVDSTSCGVGDFCRRSIWQRAEYNHDGAWNLGPEGLSWSESTWKPWHKWWKNCWTWCNCKYLLHIFGCGWYILFYIGKIFKFVNPTTKEPSHLRCEWFKHSVAIGVQLSRLHLQTWLELKSSWSTSYMSLIKKIHSYNSVLGF